MSEQAPEKLSTSAGICKSSPLTEVADLMSAVDTDLNISEDTCNNCSDLGEFLQNDGHCLDTKTSFREVNGTGGKSDEEDNSEHRSNVEKCADIKCNSIEKDKKSRNPDIKLCLDNESLTLNDDDSQNDSNEQDNETTCREDGAAGGAVGLYDDQEFDFLQMEPVRRSTSLKTYKTPPGTPSRKKAVRFADVLGLDLECVRHILNLEDPPTVPKSAMKDLKLGLEEEHKNEGVSFIMTCFTQPGTTPNFLERVQRDKVSLENCLVNDKDMTITGTVRVSNVCFHKKIIVRYTMNNWLTSQDIPASYVQNSNDGPTDSFCFTVTIPHYFTVGSSLKFAVMFTGGGNVYWDNNFGNNYAVECYARSIPVSEDDNAWLHFL